MIRNWRCSLFGHDYWPSEAPSAHGFMSEGACICRRCGDRRTVQMWMTSQLFDRWKVKRDA